MTRINCKTPSTGRAVNLTMANVPVVWTTLAEAPDFSVPDTSAVYPARDPLDINRAIRVGEIFFMTPIYVRNKSANACWVEARLLREDGSIFECPGLMQIPSGDTAMVPMQGRSLLKRNASGVNGDMFQVRAQTAACLDIWGSGEEKPSAEHIGVF